MDSLLLYDPELAKLGLIRKYMQENPHALPEETTLDLMQKKYEQESSELLEESTGNTGYQIPESPSVNLQDLEYITKTALDDYHNSTCPKFIGDLEHDNSIRFSVESFFQTRCKNYAEEIRSIIDNMIIIEEYDQMMFRNYRQLAKLVLESDGKDSATYLRKLISVARMGLPVMQKYMETSVIDGGITSKGNMPDAG